MSSINILENNNNKGYTTQGELITNNYFIKKYKIKEESNDKIKDEIYYKGEMVVLVENENPWYIIQQITENDINIESIPIKFEMEKEKTYIKQNDKKNKNKTICIIMIICILIIGIIMKYKKRK